MRAFRGIKSLSKGEKLFLGYTQFVAKLVHFGGDWRGLRHRLCVKRLNIIQILAIKEPLPGAAAQPWGLSEPLSAESTSGTAR